MSEIEALNPEMWAKLTAEGPLELNEFLDWVTETARLVARFGWEVAERFSDRELEPWQWEILLEAMGLVLDHFELMKAKGVGASGS